MGREWSRHSVFASVLSGLGSRWVGPPAICGAQPLASEEKRSFRHRKPSPKSRWPSWEVPDWRPKGLRGTARWHLPGHLSLGASLRQDRLPDAANTLRREPCFHVKWNNKLDIKTFQDPQSRAYTQARTQESAAGLGQSRPELSTHPQSQPPPPLSGAWPCPCLEHAGPTC